MKLNLYHLITFYFVASEKSFSAASEKLFLSEPAVSLHIKSLERCTGVKLLDVRRKNVFLTKAGETLFQYAEEIYERAKNAERFLENQKESSLRIGAAITFSSVIASAASGFEQLCPNVKLRIRNGPSYQIVEELADLQHDIALVVSLNYHSRKLRVVRVSDEERLVLVTLPSSDLFSRRPLTLAEIYNSPLLLPPEKSGTREVLLKRFEADGSKVRPSILVETDYLECSKRLAEEGRGIALMHITNVEREIAEGRLKILPLANEIKIGVVKIAQRKLTLNTSPK